MADSATPSRRTASGSTASPSTRTSAGRARGKTKAAAAPAPQDPDQEWLETVAGLSFQEARTALDLSLASLQSEALEVEEMAGLYRRAEAYARRCEEVLRRVEQDVIEWEAEHPPTP